MQLEEKYCDVCEEILPLFSNKKRCMECFIKNSVPCPECNKNRIDASEFKHWRKTCGPCFYNKKRKETDKCRECEDCGEPRIPVIEPDYKKICKKCYREQALLINKPRLARKI